LKVEITKNKMAAISTFEDLEIWKIARKQAHAIFQLYSTDPFSKDWELKPGKCGIGISYG
jgi:hypothetical protein